MKKNYSIILLIAVATILSFKTYATKIIVTATSNNQFSPPTVNATVGDTIRWVLGGGSHTTTCNGSSGTSHPAGAADWNSPLNSGTTSFEYVIAIAGTYQYVCLPHAPSMAGTINAIPNAIQDLNGLVNYLEVNPPTFKSNAIIKFSLASNAHIKLSVYDFAGRKIETLLDAQFTKGEHTAVWDANRIPQGIYFCRLENEEYALTRKFVRVK